MLIGKLVSFQNFKVDKTKRFRIPDNIKNQCNFLRDKNLQGLCKGVTILSTYEQNLFLLIFLNYFLSFNCWLYILSNLSRFKWQLVSFWMLDTRLFVKLSSHCFWIWGTQRSSQQEVYVRLRKEHSLDRFTLGT